MLGALFGLIGLGGLAGRSIIDSNDDADRRRTALENGFETYIDHKGVQRDPRTNHVALRLQYSGTNGQDKCLVDMKTKQILHNYSQDERDKEAAYWAEKEKEAKKAKERALRNNIMMYSKYVPDPTKKNCMFKDKIVKLRATDDLLLDDSSKRGCLVEPRFKLTVYIEQRLEFELKRRQTYTKTIEHNWNRIYEKGVSEQFRDKTTTVEERIEYAKKVGAILEFPDKETEELEKEFFRRVKVVEEKYQLSPLKHGYYKIMEDKNL